MAAFFESFAVSQQLAVAGLLGGLLLGFAARWGRFCTLGAIEDLVLGGDATRARLWLLALGVAAVGVHMGELGGLLTVADSAYLRTPVPLLSTWVGSLLFGLGMSLAGTCGFGLLARIGGGDLKSLIAFFAMALCAYSTMRGVLAFARGALFDGRAPTAGPASISQWLAQQLGGASAWWGLSIGAALIAWALASVGFRRRRRLVVAGSLVGLAVAGGWFSTALLSTDFDPYPLESHSFSAPLGESVLYFMAATGVEPRLGTGAVLGVVIGAALGAWRRGNFRWEACEDVREFRRQLLGGALMGFGGVLAFGCTVGQGLSAASVLASSAPLAMAGMFAGAWLGLIWLVHGALGEELVARLRCWRAGADD